MSFLFSLSLAVYFLCYAFEGAVRYTLHGVGHDELIFLRDIFLAAPLIALFIFQFVKNRLHPAYLTFLFVIVFHGAVMIFNIGSWFAVLYSAKMLMSMLAGAVAAPLILRPGRNMLILLGLLWLAGVAGVVLDKFFVDLPWTGMQATLGDISVDIGRDWQVTGIDKRAGGLTRSSINAAIFESLSSLVLFFNMRKIFWRMLIVAVTGFTLYCTTQKGAIIAYALLFSFILLSPRKPSPALRIGFIICLVMATILPLVLPFYVLPDNGALGFPSFILRVEDMWPHAWQWIGAHDAFPFGVGLGGISGAQRFYAPDEINNADNIFVLTYAFFGLMSFIYAGWLVARIFRPNGDETQTTALALSILVFLTAYGCVLSIIEDQMAGLFLGAAAAWLCRQPEKERHPAFSPEPALATSGAA